MANRAWPNRPLATMVIALAMLSVFTLGAGAAVAALMPAQLARWNVPRVAGRPAFAGRPGAARRGRHRPAADPGRPGRGTAPVLSSAQLGQQVGAVVTDPVSGRVLYASGAATMLQPASTAKLATAVAAVDVLGPDARFTTRVTAGPARLDRAGGRR